MPGPARRGGSRCRQIVFSIVSPTLPVAVNLVNLFDQSAVFIVLAMGEVFVLLLGEIDLSIGYVAAIGGIVAALSCSPPRMALGAGARCRAGCLRVRSGPSTG